MDLVGGTGAVEEEGATAEEKHMAFFLNPAANAILYFLLNPGGADGSGAARMASSFTTVDGTSEQQASALGANLPVSGSLRFHRFYGLVILDGGGPATWTAAAAGEAREWRRLQWGS